MQGIKIREYINSINNTYMNQKLIKGEGIFPEIVKELENASKTILVASAWFTDDQLYDVLLRKQQKGVSVSIITSDIDNNKKLDFSKLDKLGGQIYMIKNSGYGMMHEKFCVIDNRIAIHGSYNWTLNAKRNNKESVIITDHKEIVDDLINYFDEMKEKTLDVKNANIKKNRSWINKLFKDKTATKAMKEDIIEEDNNNELSMIENIDIQLNSIVDSAIAGFNREEVRNKGTNSAQIVNGDEEVLIKTMDSLYQLYIVDNQKSEERKEALKIKIQDKKESLTANILVDKNRKIEMEQNIQSKKIDDTEQIISELESDTKKKEISINNIKQEIIPRLNGKVEQIKEKISKLQIEFVKPKIKYYELIPYAFVFLGLGLALFLFYSSSAYIMLYANDDASKMIQDGLRPTTQIFNSNAFTLAMQKGGTALIYILAFVFIPLAIAFSTHNSNKIWKLFGIAVVILLDGFVAYRVSNVINHITHLSDGTENFEPFYYEANFYIVFLLSAMPFFFFMQILDKVIKIFEERHPQAAKDKMEFNVKIENERISEIKEQLEEAKKDAAELEKEIIENNTNIGTQKEIISTLKIEIIRLIENIETEYNNYERYVEKKAELYLNSIDNDSLSMPYIALKDRVNVFLEGWNKWLHDELSISRAIEKSQKARMIADEWLDKNYLKESEFKLKAA